MRDSPPLKTASVGRVGVVSGGGLDGPRAGKIVRLSDSGNPAVLGSSPVDRWLCVPAFRRVCRFQYGRTLAQTRAGCKGLVSETCATAANSGLNASSGLS